MKTDELEKLVEAATPGPWECSKNENWRVTSDNGEVAEMVPWSHEVDEADARLIAAAPDLAREVVALRKAAGDFLRCEDAVDAEAARAEKDGGWSSAPVVARIHALATLRAVLGESE